MWKHSAVYFEGPGYTDKPDNSWQQPLLLFTFKPKTMGKIVPIKLPKQITDSKIDHIVGCSGPIPCVSISFENGWRLDIAISKKVDVTEAHQIVPAEENPYFDKEHSKLKRKIMAIIKPNSNDEWFDDNKHYKEAAEEVIKLFKK